MDPITIAGSVATGLVNNAINQYNTRQERQWQERMMHYQNSYNHPAADLIRKRAAGVNPFAGELNTKPAASVGSPGAADTFPLTDPLAALKTFAEIDNINSTTNRVETETEKMLKDIALLDVALEKGAIELTEYKEVVRQKFEEWSQRNQFTVDREFKESQTRANNAAANVSEQQSLKIEAERLYTAALAATEEALREPKVALLRSQKANQDAQAASAYAIAQKTLQEGKKLEIENQQRAFLQAANAFYGIDISLMNPNFGAKLLSNYSNTLSGVIPSSTALAEFKDMLEKYTASDLWKADSKTDSGSGNLSLLYGLVSIGGSGSRSRTGDGAKK